MKDSDRAHYSMGLPKPETLCFEYPDPRPSLVRRWIPRSIVMAGLTHSEKKIRTNVAVSTCRATLNPTFFLCRAAAIHITIAISLKGQIALSFSFISYCTTYYMQQEGNLKLNNMIFSNFIGIKYLWRHFTYLPLLISFQAFLILGNAWRNHRTIFRIISCFANSSRFVWH